VSERLQGPREKVARAKEHVNDLNTKIAEFLASNPYAVVREVETETGDHVWRIKVREQPPQRLATIAGDAVHNLRSALDLLVGQLVEANGNTPGKGTMFPIGGSQTEYESARGQRYIKGVSGAAQKAIDALKPYEGGNEALWRLHRLDANDKHQRLAVVGAAHVDVMTNLAARFFQEFAREHGEEISLDEIPKYSIKPADTQFPIEDGDEIFRVAKAANPEMQENPEFGFQVALSDGEVVQGEPVIPTLTQLADYVENLVKGFAPLL
jgi:hypothetical protein